MPKGISFDETKKESFIMGRVSQFIDFINRKKMPTQDEQNLYYTHIDLEDLKDEDGKVIRKNPIKEARLKYRLALRQQKKAP